MSKRKEVVHPGQRGFYVGEEGDFTSQKKKGSKMEKPRAKKNGRRPTLDEMPARQKWAVLKRMGFDDKSSRRIIGGDKSPFVGIRDHRVVIDTSGGTQILDCLRGNWAISCLGSEEGIYLRPFSVLEKEDMIPGKID